MCFMAHGSPRNGSATPIYMCDVCNIIGFCALRKRAFRRPTNREIITHYAW